MKDIIRQIRQYTKLSQEDMAKKIGVQFATINRWENGHSIPTRLAQESLYLLCEEYNVPVYEMILKKVNEEANSLNISNNRILLYHGSKKGINGNIKPISREKCDFGKGFYMGTSPEQALTIICDFEDSKFYIVSIEQKNLLTTNIPTDINWAMLVGYNRGKMQKIKGNSFYNKYANMTNGKDLVIGSIANDRMFFVIDNFFMGNITDNALISSLSSLELGEQYVALTQKACDSIKIEKEIELSYFEKQVLKKVSEANRIKGIETANNICKAHRRDGKFFDEIIDETLKDK